MKIGVTVLHGNITNSNKKNVGNNEALKIANLLKKYCDVDFLTCKSCDDCITVDDQYDINQYNALLVINGSANMFGGLEIETMTTIYKLLHKFNNQIYYVLTDLLMPFVDYYKHIKDKEWNKYTEDDFKLKKDIIILSQFKNTQDVLKLHKDVHVKEVKYLPLALWYLSCYDEDLEGINTYLTEQKVDLIYGGSFRAGNRLKKMQEYFFDKNYSVELYGNIRESQFKNIKYEKAPKFTGKIPSYEVVKKNKNALSTIIIGDRNYNNNTITLRVIEALISNIVCFIDNDFDINHDLFFNDFFYVNNGKELEEKINLIKFNDSLRNQVLEIQHRKIEQLKSIDLGKILFDFIQKEEEKNEE